MRFEDLRPHRVPTSDGWLLRANRALAPGGDPVEGPPVLIVPGYGMNSSIFGYHPTGRSFLHALTEQGFDAWTVDLRGQGESHRGSGPRRWGLAEYAFRDLPAILDHMARITGHERIHTIGCSLGGSLLYAYAARYGAERLGRIVAMGSPLRMTGSGWFVQLAGLLLGAGLARVPFRGTRPLARVALPLLARYLPGALSIYMNARLVELRDVDALAAVVEDPQVGVNRDLVPWLRSGRLVVDGMDVERHLAGLPLEVLLVIAAGDGIVSPDSCRSVVPVLGRERVDEIVVGSDDLQVAHADLFVSEIADERVFRPVGEWLKA